MSQRFLSLIAVTIAMGMLVDCPAQGQAKKQPDAAQPAGPQPIQRTAFIAQMDSQFSKMDSDKNRQLTKAEIEQFQQSQALADAQERNRALFAQLDVDKNRQLSPAEFARLVTATKQTDATPIMARIDGNRDGQVTPSEYRTATLANFDRLDTDKNGTVTPAEMQAGGVTPR